MLAVKDARLRIELFAWRHVYLTAHGSVNSCRVSAQSTPFGTRSPASCLRLFLVFLAASTGFITGSCTTW